MKAATLTVLPLIIFALTAILCEVSAGWGEGKAERCFCQKKALEKIISEARNEGLPGSRRKPRTESLNWTETKDKVQGKKGKEAEEDQTAKLKFTAGEFYTYMIAQPFRITVSYVISQSI
uniref:Interleukin-8 variant 4 n=1 Tax=Ictalurus punctatus TaxID=7998 RepID=Q8AXZ0_ICTPU|nr:interleukin-8 variant 4 [Ictalurus punctatus]